jgi:hypothetical protein
MPGFLGGSSGGSSTGGEINFPKEFIDPVTKLRVSEPENLIDTDFEYGLQPTKWETVELINNTPSFFSKSGDTTIPNISSMTTITGSREVTVRTSLDHGLAVGTPINVSGSKAITADGSYIINSIPNTRAFTYLARETQPQTQNIEDLYTAIITGEFFQGSQIKISDARGVETDNQAISTLTVQTDSPHGFGPNTPLYFLNLNSTITQEFDSTNTEAKSFDASNNVTARTFDGSNTSSRVVQNFNNTYTSSPITVASSVSGVDTVNNTITVSHTTENFNGRKIGQPLTYAVTAGDGYFLTNPRGIVFLKSDTQLGTSSSTFQVSATPNGAFIPITSNISGTFQLADLVANFAGNNLDTINQTSINLIKGTEFEFDGDNSAGSTFTVQLISGLGNIQMTQNTNWAAGQMVLYTSTGSAASGLTNNTTYWVVALNAQTNIINISDSPGGGVLSAISGGSGTQTFQAISVSLDRDVIAIPGHNFEEADMVRYEYPVDGKFGVTGTGSTNDYFFVERVYDSTHISLGRTRGFLLDGTTEARAAASAQAIKTINPSAADGAYWIKPAGTSTAYLTYCNFSLESGGWTQIMKLSTTTLQTNSITSGLAPQSGAGFTFGPHWNGWAWNNDTDFTTLFPLVNNSNFTDIDSFSPLFYKLPFNDVMVVSVNATANRLGWRHNSTIPSMRTVTGATNLSTLGDQWLFPSVATSEYAWNRRLQVVASVNTATLVTGTPRFGFKVVTDYSNTYAAGTLNTYVTGGYSNVSSENRTGYGMAMLGVGGTNTTATSAFGGGIGFVYSGNLTFRGHGVFNNTSTSGGTSNRTFTGLAVFVR